MDTLLGAFLLPSRELRAQRARRQRAPGFNLVRVMLRNKDSR